VQRCWNILISRATMKRRFTRAGPVYIFLCVGISQIKHVPQSLRIIDKKPGAPALRRVLHCVCVYIFVLKQQDNLYL